MDDKEKKATQEETLKDNRVHLTDDDAENAAGGVEKSKPYKGVEESKPYKFAMIPDQYTR